MCFDPGEPNRVTSQINILFCLYYKCRPGPGTTQSFNRGLTVGIYINFEAVLLGPADSEINRRQLGLENCIIFAQFEFKNLKGMFIFENAHREHTIVSDPRSIRVHLEMTIFNLRFNVNSSELNWDTGQFNKMIKFTDIQNTAELGEPANPDLKFLKFCSGRKVEWGNSARTPSTCVEVVLYTFMNFKRNTLWMVVKRLMFSLFKDPPL
ncbi:hypothetical protein AVEN_270499-1 [Araneus ventricosus]|uniref:Uncharacterized protein n=1 Tax=Araneus ventricosus TaxID=182803 RepID=A0A4Y2B5Z1_ARAVE|nr:hypothetical protein AVEN_270499-1 [Araneus ventricosus]